MPGSAMSGNLMQYQAAKTATNPMAQSGAFSQSLQAKAQAYMQQAGALPSLELIELSNFKDTWDAISATDLPVFFRMGSNDEAIEGLMASCHRMVLASDGGIVDGHDTDQVSFYNYISIKIHEGTPFSHITCAPNLQ